MDCTHHPGVETEDRCSTCEEPFCVNCLVTINGQKYCGSCKASMFAGGLPLVVEKPAQVCKEADDALRTAIIGVFCFGIILEPLAIIKALRARSEIAANPDLTGKGKATAALVIAIIVLSPWLIGFLMLILGKT